MKQRVQDLLKAGDKLFEKRRPIMSYWQELADQFYPERADFTAKRYLGEEFGSWLMSGFPAMCRRDLANQFAAMLRPRGKQWFELSVGDEKLDEDIGVQKWLEYAAKVMFKAMYDRAARFTRATNEGDHDFAAFGQAVLTVEKNAAGDGLLYRCWHLRDVAWCENAEGEIDDVHRCHKWSARQLVQMFPKTVSSQVGNALKNDPYREFECRHVVMPADEYDYYDATAKRRGKRQPLISIYVDKENDTVLEEVPVPESPYVLPRWQTVSGSQYAHSPATVIALPDARLLQQITLTLLEAGEKAVNPPLVATDGTIVRDDVQIFPGGITYIDREYDERLGEALRPLETGAKGGLAFGEKITERYEALIKEAFYLNKINLPAPGNDMTAYEARQRVQEYIRTALPLFEPMEMEYNGALCEKTFNVMMRAGAFGPIDNMPREIAGREVEFKFQSPLQDATEREKVVAFQEAAQLLATAAQIDPMAPMEIDIRTAFRDAVRGANVPAGWMVEDKKALEMRAAAEQAQARAKMAQDIAQGAAVAHGVGQAATSLQEAGLVPQAGTAAPLEGAVA